MARVIYVCRECGSESLASPGCTHLVGAAEVFGSDVPKERTVEREAVEVYTAAEVREKLLGDQAVKAVAVREYEAFCEAMDWDAQWSAESPEHLEDRWLAPARNAVTAALDSVLHQSPTPEGGEAHDPDAASAVLPEIGGHVAEAASGSSSGAASLDSHPALAIFGHDYWEVV
jgi:hypothetical protein